MRRFVPCSMRQKECATLVARVQQYEEDAAVTLAESDKQVKTLVSALQKEKQQTVVSSKWTPSEH